MPDMIKHEIETFMNLCKKAKTNQFTKDDVFASLLVRKEVNGEDPISNAKRLLNYYIGDLGLKIESIHPCVKLDPYHKDMYRIEFDNFPKMTIGKDWPLLHFKYKLKLLIGLKEEKNTQPLTISEFINKHSIDSAITELNKLLPNVVRIVDIKIGTEDSQDYKFLCSINNSMNTYPFNGNVGFLSIPFLLDEKKSSIIRNNKKAICTKILEGKETDEVLDFKVLIEEYNFTEEDILALVNSINTNPDISFYKVTILKEKDKQGMEVELHLINKISHLVDKYSCSLTRNLYTLHYHFNSLFKDYLSNENEYLWEVITKENLTASILLRNLEKKINNQNVCLNRLVFTDDSSSPFRDKVFELFYYFKSNIPETISLVFNDKITIKDLIKRINEDISNNYPKR